jgi:hypothetical protein
MALLGSFQAVEGGATKQVLVYDDCLAIVSPNALGKAGLAFGAVGGVAATVANRRSLQRRQAAIGELGYAAPEVIAAAVKGVELLRGSDVAVARIEKGAFRAWKLILSTPSGKDRVLRFAQRRMSPGELHALLTPMLGRRVEYALN